MMIDDELLNQQIPISLLSITHLSCPTQDMSLALLVPTIPAEADRSLIR